MKISPTERMQADATVDEFRPAMISRFFIDVFFAMFSLLPVCLRNGLIFLPEFKRQYPDSDSMNSQIFQHIPDDPKLAHLRSKAMGCQNLEKAVLFNLIMLYNALLDIINNSIKN
jgi:hypothetical protein